MVDGLQSKGVAVTILNGGTPNNVLVVNIGSQIAWDQVGGSLYMGLAQNGSTWIALGSVEA